MEFLLPKLLFQITLLCFVGLCCLHSLVGLESSGLVPLCSSFPLGKHLEGDEVCEQGGGGQGKEGEVVEFRVLRLQLGVQLSAFPGCSCVSASGSKAQVG